MAFRKNDPNVETRKEDDGSIVEIDKRTGEKTTVLDAPVEGTTAIERSNRRFNSEQAAAIESYEDVLAFAAALGEEIEEAGNVLGDGYVLVKDKSKLVNVPFIVFDWRENPTDKFSGQKSFFSVMAVTKHPLKVEGRETTKIIFNDGSTGVAEDLRGYFQKRGRTGFIDCPNGLRASEYETTDEQGNPITATTYRLN